MTFLFCVAYPPLKIWWTSLAVKGREGVESGTEMGLRRRPTLSPPASPHPEKMLYMEMLHSGAILHTVFFTSKDLIMTT